MSIIFTYVVPVFTAVIIPSLFTVAMLSSSDLKLISVPKNLFVSRFNPISSLYFILNVSPATFRSTIFWSTVIFEFVIHHGCVVYVSVVPCPISPFPL